MCAIFKMISARFRKTQTFGRTFGFKICDTYLLSYENDNLFMFNNYLEEKKIEADNLEKIDIFSLRKHASIGYTQYLTLTLQSGLKISLAINFSKLGGHVYLDTLEGSTANIISSQIELDSSYCFFGGFRHWFLCPGKEGSFCNERVATLYLVGNEFACRHCYNLTYKTRNLSDKVYKRMLKATRLHYKAQKLKGQIKREYYAKKPTVKVVKYLQVVKEQEEVITRMNIIAETLHQKSLKKTRHYNRTVS